ncbi:ABC transporter [Halobiforma lacisalsi AJ5]|uniref:ABC transporter n=1 Tax=Natronobacterium lacisalsi AJ5 TaxID=358396 RepID=M0LCN0_NATLA|nr:hypothetical protein [Halobiforma lacisalsi]APW99296.1 ABC transporter [Halobiforma lacisalsi AJ5]EMA30873.1 ABC transporter [Halobiforma lacisalsi AJ5]
MKNIPSLAWVPLFLLWFGIGEDVKVTLIALGAFLPVYLNFSTGIRDVDRDLLEVRERLEQTTVLATHDVEETTSLADHVVVLDDQPGSVER